MAIFKLATGAAAPSGSVGGQTFQTGSFGNSIKNKNHMRQFKSDWQLIMNNYYLACCRHWSNLSAASRADWNNWSSTYPQFSKRNHSKTITGFNVFVKRNFYLWLSEELPDAYMESPAYVVYNQDYPAIEVKVSDESILLNCVFPRGNSDLITIIFVSAGKSAGRSFVDHSWRLMSVIPNASQEIDISDIWKSKFNQPPPAGTNIFTSVFQAGSDNGQFWFHVDEPIISIPAAPPAANVKLGYLYNWYAASSALGFVEGWHVPTYTEFLALITFLEGTFLAGGHLKQAGTDNWQIANTGASDSGFNTVGNGGRSENNGAFYLKFQSGYIQSSTLQYDSQVRLLSTFYNSTVASLGYAGFKRTGLAIRLIKNDSTDPGYVDIDGYRYNTVKINDQVWLAENLKANHFADGTSIPNVTDASSWILLETPGLCAYDNDESNV